MSLPDMQMAADLEKKLDAVKKNIETHSSELVLVINERESMGGCTGYKRHANYNLGILNGKFDTDYNKEKIIIPTSKNVHCTDRREDWELKQEPIFIQNYNILGLGKHLPARIGMRPVSGGFNSLGQSLHIIVGNDDVELYFRLPDTIFWTVFNQKEEGKMTKDKLHDFLQHFGRYDTSFVPALELLGAPVPGKFREEYKTEQKKQQMDIVTQLEERLENTTKIQEKIDAVYKSMKSGGYMQGGAFTPVEDEDDARVVTMGLREKLREKESGIARLLKEAVKLKMHNTPKTISLKPGVDMNVPLYITGLCEKYKIEVV